MASSTHKTKASTDDVVAEARSTADGNSPYAFSPSAASRFKDTSGGRASDPLADTTARAAATAGSRVIRLDVDNSYAVGGSNNNRTAGGQGGAGSGDRRVYLYNFPHLSRNLGILAIVVPILTFIITYSISLSSGKQAWPYLFLSSSINYQPASNIGAFGLTIGLGSVSATMVLRYITIKSIIATDARWALLPSAAEEDGGDGGDGKGGEAPTPIDLSTTALTASSSAVNRCFCCSCCTARRIRLANRLAMIVGLLADLGGLGVAAFPVHENFYAHSASAAVFFLNGGAYLMLETMIDVAIRDPKRKHAWRWRVACTVGLFVMLGISFCVGGYYYKVAEDRDSAVATASFAEVGCFLFFLLFVGSYIPALTRLKIVMHIKVD